MGRRLFALFALSLRGLGHRQSKVARTEEHRAKVLLLLTCCYQEARVGRGKVGYGGDWKEQRGVASPGAAGTIRR